MSFTKNICLISLAYIRVLSEKKYCPSVYTLCAIFFSTWGEALFMSVQNAIIVSLVYYYNKNMMGLIFFTPVYGTVAYVLCSSLTPIAVIVKLQEFNLLILLISRVSFWLLCFAHQCILSEWHNFYPNVIGTEIDNLVYSEIKFIWKFQKSIRKTFSEKSVESKVLGPMTYIVQERCSQIFQDDPFFWNRCVVPLWETNVLY